MFRNVEWLGRGRKEVVWAKFGFGDDFIMSCKRTRERQEWVQFWKFSSCHFASLRSPIYTHVIIHIFTWFFKLPQHGSMLEYLTLCDDSGIGILLMLKDLTLYSLIWLPLWGVTWIMSLTSHLLLPWASLLSAVYHA